MSQKGSSPSKDAVRDLIGKYVLIPPEIFPAETPDITADGEGWLGKITRPSNIARHVEVEFPGHWEIFYFLDSVVRQWKFVDAPDAGEEEQQQQEEEEEEEQRPKVKKSAPAAAPIISLGAGDSKKSSKDAAAKAERKKRKKKEKKAALKREAAAAAAADVAATTQEEDPVVVEDKKEEEPAPMQTKKRKEGASQGKRKATPAIEAWHSTAPREKSAPKLAAVEDIGEERPSQLARIEQDPSVVVNDGGDPFVNAAKEMALATLGVAVAYIALQQVN